MPEALRRTPEVVYPDDLEGMTIEEVCRYFDTLRQAREQGESAVGRR